MSGGSQGGYVSGVGITEDNMQNVVSTGTWSVENVVGIVFLLVNTPIFVCFTIMVWMQRHKQPLKARSPLFLLILDLGATITSVSWALRLVLIDVFPCALYLFFVFGIFPLYALPLFIRALKLWFIFGVTKARAEGEASSWFIRNRDKSSDSFLLKFWLVAGGIHFMVPVLLLATDTEEYQHTGFCGRSTQETTMLAILGIGYVLLLFLASWVLRTVHDAFNIKNELKVVGIIWLSFLVPWFAIGGSENFEHKLPAVMFPLIALLISMWLMNFWPWYRTVFSPPVIKLPAPANLEDLTGVLSTPEGYESFKGFLTEEFSVENLIFWEEVDNLHHCDEDDFRAELISIYEKFIKTGSDFEINIPAEIKKTIDETMREGTGDRSTFDQAQESIFHLMETDSFKRYKRTKHYEALVRSLKAANELRPVLEGGGLI